MNNIIFSLIVATYGRNIELDELLYSLTQQDIGKDKFEVIVVDQNNKINLDECIEKYSKLLNIIHFKSKVKGLSINRNIGIKMSTGSFVCFPDDDCQYYEDTLSTAWKILDNNTIDACIGRIYDRHKCINILKDWPSNVQLVGPYNFFRVSSSITIFCKNGCKYQFDDDLGAGTYFGSCEDADYLWNLIIKAKKVIYHPELHVNHPPQCSTSVVQEKFDSYQRGFGAFLRKNFSLPIFYLMSIALGYYLFQAVNYLVYLRVELFRRRLSGISSIIRGFYVYGKK